MLQKGFLNSSMVLVPAFRRHVPVPLRTDIGHSEAWRDRPSAVLKAKRAAERTKGEQMAIRILTPTWRRSAGAQRAYELLAESICRRYILVARCTAPVCSTGRRRWPIGAGDLVYRSKSLIYWMAE